MDQDLEGNPERFRGTPSATQLGRKTRSSVGCLVPDSVTPLAVAVGVSVSPLAVAVGFELGGECLAVGLLEILGALNELCRAELVCPQIYLLR